MKPHVYENSRIPRLLSLFFPVAAIVLWPFIFTRGKLEGTQRTHELTHFMQYKELWVVGFYLVYLYDWLRGLWRYRDTRKAYLQIRFEQEAYEHQGEEGYEQTRDRMAWKAYSI